MVWEAKTSSRQIFNIVEKEETVSKNKRYYVLARAYKLDSMGNKVYGKWSVKKSIKVKYPH